MPTMVNGYMPIDAWYIVNESGRVTTGIKTVVTHGMGVKMRNGALRSAGLIDAHDMSITNGYYPGFLTKELSPVAGAAGYIVEEFDEYSRWPNTSNDISDDGNWWVIDPTDCVQP